MAMESCSNHNEFSCLSISDLSSSPSIPPPSTLTAVFDFDESDGPQLRFCQLDGQRPLICISLKVLQIQQKGTGPDARSSHAISVVGSKAYAFGGEFTPRSPVDNKIHVFDLENRTWSIRDATGDIPPPHVGVTMAAVGTTIYVFGGRDSDHKELNQLLSFDTLTNEWTLLSSGESGPPHRSYHSTTSDDHRIYIFGGCGNDGWLNDLWAFDAKDRRWNQLASPGESCVPRGGPGLVAARGKVYGFSGEEELDDVHGFDPIEGGWGLVETSGDKPSGRSVFSAVGIGKYIVVYGGEVDPSDQGHLGAGSFSREVFALDTETRVWKRLEEGADGGEHPWPRGWCAFEGAEIGGREGLLVYGGNSPTNDRLDDMYFFAPCL